MSATPSAGSKIDAYISQKNPKLSDLADSLRKLVKKSVPNVTETVNPWGLPTFVGNGAFCYFMLSKNHLTLGFLDGTSLKDPHALLEGTGKNLRHVKLRTMEDLDREGLRELLKAAGSSKLKSPAKSMFSRKKRSRNLV